MNTDAKILTVVKVFYLCKYPFILTLNEICFLAGDTGILAFLKRVVGHWISYGGSWTVEFSPLSSNEQTQAKMANYICKRDAPV